MHDLDLVNVNNTINISDLESLIASTIDTDLPDFITVDDELDIIPDSLGELIIMMRAGIDSEGFNFETLTDSADTNVETLVRHILNTDFASHVIDKWRFCWRRRQFYMRSRPIWI